MYKHPLFIVCLRYAKDKSIAQDYLQEAFINIFKNLNQFVESKGAFEAHEMRDQNKNRILGKSVNNAVENINNKISFKLKDLNSDDLSNWDNTLLKLDGTENKTNLGANATLAVSLANAKCSALSNKKSLFKNLGKSFSLPILLMNIINGGAHADNDFNIKEFMIRQDSANNFMVDI